jgi:hypothetical protein
MFGVDDALILGGASLLGGVMSNRTSADSAQSATDFSAAQFASRYQTTVKDLTAAGLSPTLAYSQGGGSPPTGVSYQAQNPAAGLASAYSSGATADAQRDQLEASAHLSRASAWSQQYSNELADKQAKKIGRELESGIPEADAALKRSGVSLNSDKGAQLYAAAQMLWAQEGLLKKQGLTESKRLDNIVATTDKLAKETDLLEYDIKAVQDLGNLGREFSQLKPIFDILLRAMRR